MLDRTNIIPMQGGLILLKKALHDIYALNY